MSAALESFTRLRIIDRSIVNFDKPSWVKVVEGQNLARLLPGPAQRLKDARNGEFCCQYCQSREIHLQQNGEQCGIKPETQSLDQPWTKLVFIQKALRVDQEAECDVQSQLDSVEAASPTAEQSNS
jgi:hypothetical protein